MTRTFISCISCALLLSLPACATSFTGSAHIEDGRAGCEQKCAGQGLSMSGLVYLGEYSSACVCSVVGPGGGPGAISRDDFNHNAAAAAAGAAAGVMMQMAEDEQQASLEWSAD